jgi:hypothetical protein
MRTKTTFLVAFVATTALYSAAVNAKQPTKSQQLSNDLAVIISTQDKINTLGYEKALSESEWPKAVDVVPDTTQQQEALPNHGDTLFSQSPWGSDTDLPWDECNFNPAGPNCSGYSYNPVSNVNANLKNDGVQILATEVLMQTLDFFKVKHVFGKLKSKPNTFAFKVIDPVDGQPYQDLDSDTVIYAIKQFRKYVIGLLCNQPDASRVLAMINKYDVGTRFRWEMAWALLGNDLPDAPNKYMAFGVKWRKFSAAMDGIENGSVMRVRNAFGGQSTIDPGGWSLPPTTPAPSIPGASAGSSLSKVGFVAREVVSILRLVGDIASAILDLVCVSDLSTNQKKEADTQSVVYKLLDIKKKVNDRYGPLMPILDDIGKKATQAAGQPVSVFP